MKNSKQTKIKLVIAAVGIMVVPLMLVGCNTVEVAGTDIRHAGSSLENAAERNK